MFSKKFFSGSLNRIFLSFSLFALPFVATTEAYAANPTPDAQILLKVTGNSVAVEGDQDDVTTIEFQAKKSPDLSYFEFQTANQKARGRALVQEGSIYPISFQGFGNSVTEVTLEKAVDPVTSEAYIAVKKFKPGMPQPSEEGRILTGEESQPLTFSYFDGQKRLLAQASNTTDLTSPLQVNDTLTWTLDVYKTDAWTSKLMMTVITVASSELFRSAIAPVSGYRKAGLAALGIGAVVGTGALATAAYLKGSPTKDATKDAHRAATGQSRKRLDKDRAFEDEEKRPRHNSHLQEEKEAVDFDQDEQEQVEPEELKVNDEKSETFQSDAIYRFAKEGDITGLKAIVRQKAAAGVWPADLINTVRESADPADRQTLLEIVTQIDSPTIGHRKIAKYLWNTGAQDPSQMFSGEPILRFINKPILQDPQVLKFYLEKGAKANYELGRQVNSPLGLLLLGVENGNFDDADYEQKDLILKVEYLIQAGADINQIQPNQVRDTLASPLQWVIDGRKRARASFGPTQFYDRLYKVLKTAEANTLFVRSTTVGDIMRRTGAANPFSLKRSSSASLLSSSSSPTIAPQSASFYEPKPALFLYASTGMAEELNQHILDEVAETGRLASEIVNVIDTNSRQTPLQLAALQGYVGAVNVLLGHGANPNLYDLSSGKPILQHILSPVLVANPILIKILLDGGADVHGLSEEEKRNHGLRSQYSPLALMVQDAATQKGASVGEVNARKLQVIRELFIPRNGDYAKMMEKLPNGKLTDLMLSEALEAEAEELRSGKNRPTYLKAVKEEFKRSFSHQ